MTSQIAVPVDASNPTPAAFETWASDADVFSGTPHWPSQNQAHAFHASVLARVRASSAAADALDVQCAPPPNAGVGRFPTTGSPTPCIAEEVKRNKAQYDYIVGNNLNTQAGLRRAFARSFTVDMPATAVAVKGDWVPVPTLLQWIPQLRGSTSWVEKLYLTTHVGATEYALVALHVSSKRNPYWVWGTFEHRLNPGRCDYIGCYDSFGATTPVVQASDAYNSQYGACAKTPALQAMMTNAHLSPVWENYCLKGTETTYVAANGKPQALGSSVIEGINANGPISASSCITCHYYASFGASGTPTGAATAMLDYNATGRPIFGTVAGSQLFDFTWGVLLAPK